MTSTHVDVVCLYWGDKYDVGYVSKLRNMVSRYLSIPHSFTCLTDNLDKLPNDIQGRLLLDTDLEGWWNKLSIFNQNLWKWRGTVLYLDLDIVVVGGLDKLFTYKPEEPLMNYVNELRPDQEYNGSVIRFDPNQNQYLWDRFNKDVTLQMFGDHEWISKTAGFSPYKCYPAEWIKSYKYSNGSYGTETSILVFHGQPNPHQVLDESVRLNTESKTIRQLWY